MGSSSILTVVLFDPAAGRVSGETAHAAGLQAHGLDVRMCIDQAQLADFAAACTGTSHLTAGQPGLCFLLNGTVAQSCAAAAYIRGFSQDVGILVLVPYVDETALISLFHSGVDAYCPATASVALLVVALSAIRRRCLPRPAQMLASMPAPGPSAGSRQWLLADHGWVLVGAGGGRIPLTTGERAFLEVLFHAPDGRASHAQLIAALDHAYGGAGQASLRTRLGILVTRLRRKCRDHREPLPLKSIHGWGYMFAGAAGER